MSDPARRIATYDELVRLPEHVVGELVGGELVVTPRPAPAHARAASGAGAKLVTEFDHGDGGPGGWQILFEPELHLGDDVLVPDLAGWRRARLPTLPDEAFFTLAPDWLCEVVSPITAHLDRRDKLPRYLAAGVQHVWIVDPLATTVEAFAAGDGAWVLLGVWAAEDAEARTPPFDAVPIDISRWWPPKPPPEDPPGGG